MTRRSRGWIGAAAVAVIVILGVIWAFGLFEAETNLVADDQQEQLRNEKGDIQQGIVGQTSDDVTLPAETDEFIEGSTAASDPNTINEPDGDTEGGSVIEPDDVVSPERGEVQNDTGIVTTNPGSGTGGDPGGTGETGGQTDNTLREAD